MRAEDAELLEFVVGNPLVRSLLWLLDAECECGKRLNVALDLYVGELENACVKCRAAASIISRILKRGGKALGMDEDAVRERFKDKHWRKGLICVLRGIEKFGVRRPFVPGSPFLVVWDFTYKCNLRCKHCYAAAPYPRASKELNTRDAMLVVDKLADADVPILAFSGGEPLMRKDFFDIASYAADKGMYVGVATNGTLISEDVAARMRDAGVKFVQISLDGASAETHDAFRGVSGAFEKTLEGIKNVVAAGDDIFVDVSTTITRFNIEEVPKIIELCDELGVRWFMGFNFVPSGRGVEIVEYDLSPEERETLLNMLLDKRDEMQARGSSLDVLTTAPQYARVALQRLKGDEEEILVPTHFYNPRLSGKLQGLAEFIGGCGAGRCYIAVEPDGTLMPCVFFKLPLGNIMKVDFEEFWASNEILNDLRDRSKLKGHCSVCKFRYYCGGCRARAYGYTGDYLAGDPGCILNR